MKTSKWDKELVLKTIKDLEKLLKKRPVKRDNNALYQATRKHFGTWNNAMKVAGYKVLERQRPILPQKLTPELSYFLGLLITDGHLQFNKNHRSYRIYLFTSYKKEVKIIYSLFKFLFKCKPGIYKKKKYGFNIRTNYSIHIGSIELVKYINKTLCIPTGPKSLTIRIPKIFFSTNKQNIYSFIRGVIDGDGSIKNYISISSGSKMFLKDLSKLFTKIKINTTKILNRPTAYEIYINKSNLPKLYKLLYNKAKFYYPRKQAKLKTVIFKKV